MEDYISLSAGVTKRSDQSAIYIVRANGSVTTLDSSWWRFSEAGMQTLRDLEIPSWCQWIHSTKNLLRNGEEVTQIIYQGMVSVAALANL